MKLLAGLCITSHVCFVCNIKFNIFIVEKRLVLKTKDNEILKNKISLSPFFFLFSVFLYQPLQVVLNLQYS